MPDPLYLPMDQQLERTLKTLPNSRSDENGPWDKLNLESPAGQSGVEARTQPCTVDWLVPFQKFSTKPGRHSANLVYG